MHCSQCGTPAPPGAAYCAHCGSPVAWPGYHPTNEPTARRGLIPLLVVVATIVVLVAAVTAGILLTRGSGGTHSAAQVTSIPTGSSASTAAPREVASSTSVMTPSSTTPAATPTPRDFATIYASEQSGVVRIEVVGCSESGIGSGFLLSPTLVATVNHVITDSVVVSLVAGDQHTTGHVIGSDPATDLALVRADRPLTGFHFTFAPGRPRVGDRVAAIGFPIGGPITLTQGGVSGLDRDEQFSNGESLTGLIQTDTALNPGNSGGPLLDDQGRVLALVVGGATQAAGIGFGVPSWQAGPRMRQWTDSPEQQPAASCSTPTGPDQPTTVSISGLTPDASQGVTATFEQYFDGINSADYRSAWLALSPRLRGASSKPFAEGVSTSYDSDFTILGATQVDGSTAHVALQFVSVQDADHGPDGDTCDVWHLVYTLIAVDGTWFIDGTRGYHGSTHDTC